MNWIDGVASASISGMLYMIWFSGDKWSRKKAIGLIVAVLCSLLFRAIFY